MNFRLNEYTSILEQLKSEKFNGEVLETSYTKRIKSDEYKQMIFADEITHPHVMKLINLVKKDAELFKTKKNKFENLTKKSSYEIDFYDFIDRKEYKTNLEIEGTKIDINEAYWQCAINMGLISDETNDFLNDIFWGLDFLGNPKDKKKLDKKARLKALGSLATVKTIYKYIDGKLIDDLPVIITDEQNRQIYLSICDIIANVMSDLVFEFYDNVIYYYWDCVFIDKNINKNLIFTKIKELGYSCKVEGISTFKINRLSLPPNILDLSTGKDYPIDKKHIIY